MTNSIPVNSDREAFDKVLTRLQEDVGTILRLIPDAKVNGHWVETAPFWALARLLFPIAELVGNPASAAVTVGPIIGSPTLRQRAGRCISVTG